ncbi:MAG: hypothetical protein WBM43_12150 [Flavobacteriaceae bacterium]
MKAIVTIIFILFIGLTAQAQNKTEEVKVETVKTEIATVIKITQEDNAIARLYRRPNSRVKKALNFTTKRNRAKMA